MNARLSPLWPLKALAILLGVPALVIGAGLAAGTWLRVLVWY